MIFRFVLLAALLILQVNGQHNALSFGCTLGQRFIPCDASDNVLLDQDEYRDLLVLPLRNTTLSIQFQSYDSSSNPSPINFLLLDDKEYQSLLSSNTCSIKFSPIIPDINRIEVTSANFSFRIPDLVQDDTYHLVFWNCHSQCDHSEEECKRQLHYTIESVPPPEGFWICFGVVMALMTTLFVIFMLPCILLCSCVALCCTRTRYYNKDGQRIRYPFIEPKSIKFLEKCQIFKKIPLEKPCNGFLTYYLNGHDLLWLCYPEYNQRCSKYKRVFATIGLYLVLFLYQEIWSNWVIKYSHADAIKKIVPRSWETTAVWLARLVVADFFLLLYRIMYRPYMAILQVVPSEMLWGKSKNKALKILGFFINLLGILILFGLIGAVAYFVHQELNNSLCFVFLFNVGIPFFASEFWRSVPGAVTAYILYRLKSTWGKWPSDYAPVKDDEVEKKEQNGNEPEQEDDEQDEEQPLLSNNNNEQDINNEVHLEVSS